MGLLSQVRAALSEAGRRASDLARTPQVTRLRERRGNVVVDRARTMKQKLTSRAQRGDRPAESTGAGSAPGVRRRRHTLTWRPRFLRSRPAHLPPRQDNPRPHWVGRRAWRTPRRRCSACRPPSARRHPNRLQVLPTSTLDGSDHALTVQVRTGAAASSGWSCPPLTASYRPWPSPSCSKRSSRRAPRGLAAGRMDEPTRGNRGHRARPHASVEFRGLRAAFVWGGKPPRGPTTRARRRAPGRHTPTQRHRGAAAWLAPWAPMAGD
jgi:hypothetical protein